MSAYEPSDPKHETYRERYADMTDHYRKQAKENPGRTMSDQERDEQHTQITVTHSAILTPQAVCTLLNDLLRAHKHDPTYLGAPSCVDLIELTEEP